jgi:hypothetical protein
LEYQGDSDAFLSSPVIEKLIQSKHVKPESENTDASAANDTVEDISQDLEESKAQGMAPTVETTMEEVQAPVQSSKPPRKLVEDEARAVGRIGRGVWLEYIRGAGGPAYWSTFIFVLILASLAPVAENGWIK